MAVLSQFSYISNIILHSWLRVMGSYINLLTSLPLHPYFEAKGPQLLKLSDFLHKQSLSRKEISQSVLGRLGILCHGRGQHGGSKQHTSTWIPPLNLKKITHSTTAVFDGPVMKRLAGFSKKHIWRSSWLLQYHERCYVMRREEKREPTTGLTKVDRACLGGKKMSLRLHRDQDFARFGSESDENTQHSLD